jgi:DNA-binding CsgD family transcriptional regulator
MVDLLSAGAREGPSMSGGDRSDALRDALAVVVSAGEIPDAVRMEIAASWQRSSRTGLRPERFEVPHDPDVESDALLVRAACPVLDELTDDLVTTRMSVLLTNDRAHVLERRVPDGTLQSRLDGISLAPGFVYAESTIGTNAIGTALAQRGPSVVYGHEHFADALTTMSCAAAPITDPRSGRLLGAVDLTCWAGDAGPLMLPLARRAAREIEQRLFDDARLAERVLLQRFLRERRRVKGPLVFVNERTMITNAAADRLVEPADEAILWDCARRLLAAGRADPSVLALSHGAPVTVRCQAVLDGGLVLGALLRLRPVSQDEVPRPPIGSRPPFGWESVTDAERSVIDLVAQGLTNRQVGLQLFVSAYTVDSHLRAIFRKLDVRTRVELTRVALEHDTGSFDSD